jgi:uncharacterized phage protein gp47/JayE
MADPTPLYKTPDEYLLLGIDAIRASGAQISDFNVGSGARTISEAFAAMLSMHSLQLEQLRLNTSIRTATGASLDVLADNYRVDRHQAVAATGTVTITRQSTTGAMTVPAGSARLATRATPTQPSQSFLTTADAVFADGDASKTVAAIADVGGRAGDLTAGVVLLTIDAINGVDADGGVVAATDFTGGTDVETDDQLRVRIPLEVQGRVKGTTPAYMAAALRVPGALSAQVLRAGDTGPNGTLAGGDVEVYYEGSSSLLAQVSSEVAGAAEINDNPAAFNAASERLVAAVTVYVLAGADTTAVHDAVRDALKAVVDDAAVGQTIYYSNAVTAVHDVTSVVSAGIPFAQWRKFSEGSGTAHDIVIAAGKVGGLADADITVTVVEL